MKAVKHQLLSKLKAQLLYKIESIKSRPFIQHKNKHIQRSVYNTPRMSHKKMVQGCCSVSTVEQTSDIGRVYK